MRRPRTLRALALVSVMTLATACAVGPDYHTPDAPVVSRYTPEPLAPALVEGRDLPAEWWTVFQCPALDALVRQALTDSPTLAGAQAKLGRAQQDLEAGKGVRLPQADLRASATRVDIDPESFDTDRLPVETPFTLYDVSAQVSYTLDLFGRTRRELEGLAAVVDYQRFQLEAARLSIAGNVVTAAIREASLRQQIERTREVVSLEEKMLEIAERRERLGAIPRIEVAAQRSETAEVRAGLPDLERRLAETRHRLAVLLGQVPGEASLPEFHLDDLKLPAELPLSLPSELARQRPDIMAAEALLHEASARVGVATADLYPHITLSATGGSLSTVFANLLGPGTWFTLLGGKLMQPIFHGGTLRAEKRAAMAAFDQAGATYREVLLTGFQDVADVLVALDADAKRLRDRSESAAAAKTILDVTSQRYESGGVSHIELLEAQRRLQRTRIEETRALADRYADSAALFQALGGGWWVEKPATPPDPGPEPGSAPQGSSRTGAAYNPAQGP
ncbi:MAG TPA: efflux transporter outer membrane subunit [Verrucomicrobiae bacterium]|nr:efflux transporter outer membrane subunit [Verrucomicrobiae bacterium]